MKAVKSWKTTAAGICAGIGILATQVGYLLDSNPETVLDWKTCLAGLGALGIGWFSRDNDKSSEDVGNGK